MPSEPVLTYQAILATPILCGRSLRPTPDSTPCPQHFFLLRGYLCTWAECLTGQSVVPTEALGARAPSGELPTSTAPSHGVSQSCGLTMLISQLSPLTLSQTTPLRCGELSSGSPLNGFPLDFCRTYLITPKCFCANCRASMRTYKRLLVCFLFSILLLRMDKGHELNHAAYSTRIFSVCFSLSHHCSVFMA